MILSRKPEGHDKPLKYPLMFQICDAVLINKIDVLPYFDFDMERVKKYIQQRNPQAKVFPISAKTGGRHGCVDRVAGCAGKCMEAKLSEMI